MKHIVGFSGGVDSQATALWCRRHFDPADVILVNSDAGGNEHPMTTEFIENYSRTIHPVVMLSPCVQDMGNRATGKIAEMGLKPDDPLTFDLLASLKGRFPSRKAQFCTYHLKLAPQARWINANRDGLLAGGYERYAGVRRDESANRAHVMEREWDDTFLCWLNRPICKWTKHEVFAYLKEAGEEINPLYRLGFNRVGCAPCINSSKEDVLLWVTRFPEMIDKVRNWERRVGRTFFPPCVPGLEINWIDQVVDWSKTVRGGKQYALPLLQAEVDGGLCMSNWGLCE
jgi:3'-phosphoadenosine 5'-phosphosulfate sulfotransferase (PAPS reductase)/FAD synthetase